MEVKQITVGTLLANCYLCYDPQTKDTFIIDPGDEADFITTEILNLKLKPQGILLTHGHYDHCLACLELKLNFNLPIFLDQKDVFLYQKAAQSASHWSQTKAFSQPPTTAYPSAVKIGDKKLEIIPTPGHTPGSICLKIDNLLFTGDTLFQDSVGRTDFSYSEPQDLKRSLKKISSLPPETIAYPGHGPIFSLSSSPLCSLTPSP